MTSEEFGDMFAGDSADMCAGKFLLVLMGGQAKGLACADPEARTTIGTSRIGPSGAVQTVSDSRRPLLVRPECVRQRSELRWPLFCIFLFFLVVVGTAVIQNQRRGCRRASNFCMGP